MEQLSGIITFDRLCKMFGCDSLEDYTDFVCRNSSCPPDWTEEDVEAEEKAAVDNYISAVEFVAEKLFKEHALLLVELKTKPLNYRILTDGEGWKGACRKLIMTINGVGSFEFSSVKEFKDHGPYNTYRQAALYHIGWIASWPAVYEGSSAKYMVERRMR